MFNTIVVAVATLCATATAASTPLVWLDGGRSQQQQQQQQQRRRAGKYKVSKKRNVQKSLRKRTCAQAAKKPNTWCKRKLKDTTRMVADICLETCKPATRQRPR